MKNTTKQFNTHFNFAILAIITVGFLLWHSIAIFNLEQELQSLQSNTAISKKASIQKDNTQGTETENTDTEIIYNEDGSIDTSNWKTCHVGVIDFFCPPSWDTLQRGIINVPREEYDGIVKAKQVTMTVSGVPFDPDPNEKNAIDKIIADEVQDIENRNDSCSKVIDKPQIKFIECATSDIAKYTLSYHRIAPYVGEPGNDDGFDIGTVSVSTINKQIMENNEKIIEIILSKLVLGSRKFMPSI